MTNTTSTRTPPGPGLGPPQKQLTSSNNAIITAISILLLLVIIYPWIIAVTLISFVVGFTCLDHLDKFLKSCITSGKFGPHVQSTFKNYIDVEEERSGQKKNEVTIDPLRDYLKEAEHQASRQSQQQQQQKQQEIALTQAIQNTLAIPGRSTNSSAKSSPEKSRSLLDSPARSISSASSRRVSEDVPTSSLVTHQQTRRESSNPSPSPSRSSAGTPSPSKTLKVEVTALRVDQELRVDVRVDKSFGRLCTNIIDYYISPSWAPYDTRRQLKLSFKKLLTSVGEEFNKKFILDKGDHDEVNSSKKEAGYPAVVKLAREKLLPLILHYTDKILSRGLVPTTTSQTLGDPEVNEIISPESKRRVVLKIRKFCRKIFERFLHEDDQNCKLWLELCIAVLADGVLINVMHLGRDKLPELFEEVVDSFKKSCKSGEKRKSKPNSITSTPRKSLRGDADIEGDGQFFDSVSSAEGYHHEKKQDHDQGILGEIKEEDNFMEAQEESSLSPKKVPFLLDSFLDPPYNLDKPDQIVSRWRPTLKDIVSETDLLYPLIQYMKHVGGQQSLAYLQGVLDEFPHEGDPYCRRVLELEYLPGFCRSSLLLETLGLDRVEVALDVGATDPFSMRRGSAGGGGHARSASYGGPSTSSFREFLKIEQGIVDGLPLSESSYQNQSSSSSSSGEHSDIAAAMTGTTGNNGSATSTAMLPGAGPIEPSLAFKRRPHLEMYIAKFMKSTTKSWKQFYDPLADKCESAMRVGIDAKSYDEWNHPEVNSRVSIQATTDDIYDSLVDLASSLMRNSSITSPFFTGLAKFLKPYLMPVFDSQLEKNLSQILSVDLLVTVVDLIADVYEVSGEGEGSDNENDNDSGGAKSATGGSSPSQNNEGLFSADDYEDDDSLHLHSSSCTTCDPSFKSTLKSFLAYFIESFMVNIIDLDHFVKCFKQNREFIFLFFVDLLDVLVSEIVEK